MAGANEKKMFDLLLDEVSDTLEGIAQRCLKLETSDQAKELQVIFRAAHNVKGAAQLYGLGEFGAFVHVFEDVLNVLQKSGRPVAPRSIDILLSAHEFLTNWVARLRENSKYVPDTQVLTSTLRNHIEDIKADRSLDVVSEHPPTPAPEPVKPSNVIELPKRQAAPRGARATGTLRISSQKIDEVMQLIGELSIQQGILFHHLQQGAFSDDASRNAVVLNQKTLKNLYDLALTLRMQSAESLFQRLEKITRDIAREQNKKVQVRFQGADTPLDKTVVELITDPMIHIVRNAIDHGLEDVATRERIGKPVPATLTIKVQQDTGQALIAISDDGRGMDPSVILEKARSKGLIGPAQLLTEDEIYKLIFLPGFSTRDVVTEISGRGVGMDIVQKAIQNLGGRIEIRTKKGFGTTFMISLPASLEIIDGLLVRVDGTLYIVPRQEIIEIIDLSALNAPSAAADGGHVILLRDRLMPLEDLRDYIGMEHAGPAPARTSPGVGLVVTLEGHSKLALRVDHVLSQQQIVVRPMAENLAHLPGFTGVTILGNGEPAMIVSTAAVAASYLKWIDPRTQGPASTDAHGESA